jgi:hypothetical protein
MRRLGDHSASAEINRLAKDAKAILAVVDTASYDIAGEAMDIKCIT